MRRVPTTHQHTCPPARSCAPGNTDRTVGWAAFSFPSPRSFPSGSSGRGRIVRRLLAIPTAELAKPVCAKHRLRHSEPGGKLATRCRKGLRKRGLAVLIVALFSL